MVNLFATVTLPLYAYRSVTNGHPAHLEVTATDAASQWANSLAPIDWAVSGDESRLAYGYLGMRGVRGVLWGN